MILLMVLSCYKLNSDASQTEDQYNAYLKEARQWAENGISARALQYYEAAIALHPSLELDLEVAEYYRGQGEKGRWLEWCKRAYEEYPTDPGAYDCIMEAYMESKDYKSCNAVLDTASKRKVSSDYLRQVAEEIAYYFYLDYNVYEEAGIFSGGYCPVESEGAWGFVSSSGSHTVSCIFAEVGYFSAQGYAPVVTQEGEAYFIDKSGNKIYVTQEPYQRLGLMTGGLTTARKKEGGYVYLDSELKEAFGNYEYASAMNGGIAAVKTGDIWMLIDSSGNRVSQTDYSDVKLDEKEIAFRNNRLFVRDGNGYSMVDSAGNRIGTLYFEDAHIFNDGTYAAVKINGSWSFVDKDGNLKSDQTYEDARSYANGLAAVKINGKWGFADLDGNVRIDPQFFDAKDFNDQGSCFVKTGDCWQLLRLYR